MHIHMHMHMHMLCMHACMHTYIHNIHYIQYIQYIQYIHYMHYIHYIHTLHTLHYITLHYITLHYITLHYITLHYITLHTYIHIYIYHAWSIICGHDPLDMARSARNFAEAKTSAARRVARDHEGRRPSWSIKLKSSWKTTINNGPSIWKPIEWSYICIYIMIIIIS